MSPNSAVAPGGDLLGSPQVPLALRVESTARRGQTVRLRSAKITVGSSARCSLRLRGKGIAPLHCIILHGRERTIVRRWSPDTRLNEQSFEDAELQLGDRLAIGPVELEVVPDPGRGGTDDLGLRSKEIQRLAQQHRTEAEQWDHDRD